MAGPDVRQCRDCGKLFQFYGSHFCRECLDKMDDYYVKVREYIYEHPHANLNEVSEETEVDSKYIQQFLREGRLEFSHPDASGLVCKNCGKPIGIGTYCDDCKAQMAQSLNATIKSPAPEQPKRPDGRTKPSKGMHVDLSKRDRF